VDHIKAQFPIGQVVHHVLFDYRGVIFDVDPCFSGTEEWYGRVAKSRPPRDKPWYHVLVDGQPHTTYVAEKNLEIDAGARPIKHILLGTVFGGFENGIYISKLQSH
jgi:heat shock protein HspQ